MRESDPESQDPRETTSQKSGPAADSGAASSTTSDPYVADPGPGFDPREQPPQAPQDPVLGPALVEWDEDQVRTWLHNGGDLAHASLGVGELDWAMTQADLDRIAPPLTRILNRFEPSRIVAAYSDPAAVAVGFGMYGWRSALERRAVLHSREQGEPVLRKMPAEGWDQPVNGAGPGPVEHPDDYVPLAKRLRPRQEDPGGNIT